MPKIFGVVGKEVFGFIYSIIFWWKLGKYMMSGKCSLTRLIVEWLVVLQVFLFCIVQSVTRTLPKLNVYTQDYWGSIIFAVLLCIMFILCFLYPIAYNVGMYKTIKRQFPKIGFISKLLVVSLTLYITISVAEISYYFLEYLLPFRLHF